MAKIYPFALLSLAFTSILTTATSQQTIPTLPKGYYIVVAAYFSNQESFAQRYSNKLNEGGLHAKYGLEPTHKLCFVYLDRYTDFTESVQQMLKARKEGVFDRAWVRTIREGADEPLAAKKEEPLEKKAPSPVAPAQNPKPEAKVAEEVKPIEPPKTEVVEKPQPAVRVPRTLANTPAFISLYNSTTHQVIDGQVDVVDTERGKLLTKVKGNTDVNLPNPNSKTGELSLVTNEFGFRKEQVEINYLNTEADTSKSNIALEGSHFMVNFGLSRIHKGDIATLYNVYFYNDAAIMLPESKYQLNSLLQLFTENPKVKVILHGHTNGNGRGKIVYMGPSKDFFNITKDVVNGSGSAKELSLARAKVIREWLLKQGIEDSRVVVKGWGGTRMIHDKNSANARKNIRVDVEVVDE